MTRPLRERTKVPLLISFLIGTAVLATSPPVHATAIVTHIYELNNSFADALGGPALTPAGGTLNPTNYSFGPNQGLLLDNALMDPADYSIEVIFNFSTLSGFRKIIDFKNRASDRGLYNLNTALNFFPFVTGPSSAFTANVDAHLVVTRASGTAQFKGYVNGGAPQITFMDSAIDAIFTATNNRIRFFQDDFIFTGEASAGVVDRIRIYDGVLTQSEVTALFSGGSPPSQVPEPSSLLLLGSGLAGLAGWRWKQGRARLETTHATS